MQDSLVTDRGPKKGSYITICFEKIGGYFENMSQNRHIQSQFIDKKDREHLLNICSVFDLS